MRPKKPETTGSTDLFRARLDQIINLKHELARLRRQDRLGLDRWRDRAALQRQGPARDRDALCDRAPAAQTHLQPVRRRRMRPLGP